MKKIGKIFLIILLLTPLVFAEPIPSFVTKGTYAIYDINATVSAQGMSMSITGTMKWEVKDRTSNLMIIDVSTSLSAGPMKFEYEYEIHVNPNTGKVIKVKPIKGAPAPGAGIQEFSKTIFWYPTNVKVGSKINLPGGGILTIVGEEIVTDKSGKAWNCWKGVTEEGVEIYFDKSTGLPIKVHYSQTAPGGTIVF
ncbi:MAG TPA: hypothetical protein ENF87_00915, partial [Thermoproteales archaeon]|nr:hypothetical protein [Thermoproteales archaeon]